VDEESRKSEEEEVMGEGIGEQEMEELVRGTGSAIKHQTS